MTSVAYSDSRPFEPGELPPPEAGEEPITCASYRYKLSPEEIRVNNEAFPIIMDSTTQAPTPKVTIKEDGTIIIHPTPMDLRMDALEARVAALEASPIQSRQGGFITPA